MPGETRLESAVAMLVPGWEHSNPVQHTPLLGDNSIHLWALDLEQNEADLAIYLSSADHQRAGRIAQAVKRRLYLGGRAGMKCLLSTYIGVPARDLEFAYGVRGKPVLADSMPAPGIHFNYSLSQNKVLYAFSADRELGVDMEALPRRTNAELLARRCLTQSERTAWMNLPESVHNDAMLCCWTRKEAYGKALGVGIRYYLNEVDLFSCPASSRFSSSRAGLFKKTHRVAMPDWLDGLQIRMPFPAVAALMYSLGNGQTGNPQVQGKQLVLGDGCNQPVSH